MRRAFTRWVGRFVAAVCAIVFVASLTSLEAQQPRPPFPGQGFVIDMLDYKVTTEQPLAVPAPGVRQRLRTALQAGRHAIICRHGATDWLAPDVDDQAGPELRADQSRQRNLSDLGEAQARAIRSALDHLGVRLDAVLATFYFRTRDFARIATGREPEMRDELLGIAHRTIAPWFSIAAEARHRPGITFISAHGQPVGAMRVPGLALGEGDCLIARFEDAKSMTVIGRLTPSEWRQMLVP